MSSLYFLCTPEANQSCNWVVRSDAKNVGYNPLRYLFESLVDLNKKLTNHGGSLYMLRGDPVLIFKRIKEKVGLNLITFEQVIHFCKHKDRIKYSTV